jgi:hypothetical protein
MWVDIISVFYVNNCFYITGTRVVAHYVSQACQGKSQHITRAVLTGKSKTDIIDAESGVAAMQYGGSKALMTII